MSKKEMICIACPIGCHLSVMEENGNYLVEGNQCPRGEKYGLKEVINPTRMITTTVKITGAHFKRLPVKSSEPIPKKEIFRFMCFLDTVEVKSPIKKGETVIKDILGLGIDVVSSRSM
ncbi:DUF1667 domain-containing protein [Alkalicella caledoniensis]|uniref:DUF1667 domain-containing protein n=1 Tax=Alkalicella caledoniensis TaxID=2731377 RepID=A0A7G9W7G3_ALKCA|nr:DUF1667 domain-containing protein [Alkalicella caledoniensis]QNO14625.1 DUF1667 domain-containing protein [Alkalicella caledoniensis]